jgi:uncharacterized protein YdeI (YjbR/CyaY-like superfamily)
MATGRGSVSFEPKNAEDLRRFFEINKDRYHELWVVLNKKKSFVQQPVTFNEAVNEAVMQGLIDSRSKGLSEQKYAVRFTTRRVKK